MDKPKRIDVGAAWKKTNKSGDPYLALSFKQIEVEGVDLTNCWVNLVKNNFKKSEKHPDYIVQAEPKDNAAPKQKPQQSDEFGF